MKYGMTVLMKRNKTFGRGKKGTNNKGAEQKWRREKCAEQKGHRAKSARDHDVASPLHSRS